MAWDFWPRNSFCEVSKATKLLLLISYIEVRKLAPLSLLTSLYILSMIGRGKGDKKEGRGLKALSKYYYSKSHFQLKCVAQTLKDKWYESVFRTKSRNENFDVISQITGCAVKNFTLMKCL